MGVGAPLVMVGIMGATLDSVCQRWIGREGKEESKKKRKIEGGEECIYVYIAFINHIL